MTPSPNNPTPLQQLVGLEGEILDTADRLSLKHLIVNKIHELIPCGHIIWLERRGHNFKIIAISSQAKVDNTTPFSQWLTQTLKARSRAGKLDCFTAVTFKSRRTNDTFTYPFSQAVYVPLLPDRTAGALLLTRDTPFNDTENLLLQRLAKSTGTRWAALGRKRRARMAPRKTIGVLSTITILALAAFIPVPMTELAPAEIVADTPFIVTAPIDGVVDNILVPPNTPVSAGALLARLNNTSYLNEFKLAGQEKNVAETKLRQASLSAFIDEKSKREIAVAKAEKSLALARERYAQDRLNKTELRAPIAGLAIYSDPQDWIGRPVATGEAIIQIADPTRVLLRIDAPLASGESLREGARVRIFMDADPVTPLEGDIIHASYYASEKAEGTMVYTAYARLKETDSLPRIGARGVAKIYSDTAPLGFWLLRRPLTALRQFIGL